jgi:hypothetical protein
LFCSGLVFRHNTNNYGTFNESAEMALEESAIVSTDRYKNLNMQFLSVVSNVLTVVSK